MKFRHFGFLIVTLTLSSIGYASLTCKALFAGPHVEITPRSDTGHNRPISERIVEELKRSQSLQIPADALLALQGQEYPAWEIKDRLSTPDRFGCVLKIRTSDNYIDTLNFAGELRLAENGYELHSVDGTIIKLDPSFIDLLNPNYFQLISFYPKDIFQTTVGKYVKDIPNPKIIDLSDHNYGARLRAFSTGLKRTGEIYSPEFFTWFSDHLSETKRFLVKLYPDYNPVLLIERVERELGSDYLPLFLHPQVAARWGEALEYAKQKRGEKSDLPSVYQLYKAFEKHAGTIKLYRGMVLTEKGAKKIISNGLRPFMWDREEILGRFFSELNPDSNFFMAQTSGAYSRAGRGASIWQAQLVQSFTKDRLVAESLPYWQEISSHGWPDRGSDRLPDGKFLYVFEVEVPVWDIMEGRNFYSNYILQVDDHVYEMNRDSGFEYFLGTTIGPSRIISTIPLTDGKKPPMYSMYKKKAHNQ